LTGAGGQMLLFHAVHTGPTYLIFPIIALSPVITIALSMLFLKERVTKAGALGVVLALVAMASLTLHGQRKPRPQTAGPAKTSPKPAAAAAAGRVIVEIPKDGIPLEESVRLTLEAMAAGPDVIFQGALLEGVWGGYTDFLERIERPSSLGAWSYEVVDTKLKRKPDPKHVLQLCLYSDLLATVQGIAPEAAHLQLGDGSRFTVRLSEVSAYARYARRMLQGFLAERPETRPEPVSSCDLCRWSDACADQWEREDSLALVAGISRSQRQKLEAAGVNTMAGLAARDERVPRMAVETQHRLVSQARLQSARRAGGPPSVELRDAEPGKGFGLLPAPDDGDIFYDIEGDPYFPGGLEYLHGLWYREAGEWVFRAFWAHTRDDEGRAVADLLTFLVDHMRRHPAAHIYHYANYEIAALRRLTSQHRTGEAAMDQLQRERRFVDLFKVVSGAMIASEKGYSIKDLEAFYMEKRAADVATAGASVVFYEAPDRRAATARRDLRLQPHRLRLDPAASRLAGRRRAPSADAMAGARRDPCGRRTLERGRRG